MLKIFFGTLALVAMLVQTQLAGAQVPPSPSPSPYPMPTASAAGAPSPLPMPSAAASAAPYPTPSPSPVVSATPSESPSPVVSPTVTPLPTPIVAAADAPPQIVAVQISDPVLRSGETVTGTVITSTNVAAVDIRIVGHALRMVRSDFGIWQMSYVVPRIPFFMRHNYTAQVLAMNSAGLTAEQDLPIALR